MTKDKIKSLVRELLIEIGEDPDREGLQETPARVADLFSEIFSGYHADSELGVSFGEQSKLVALRDVEFYSVCEHHLLPFYGKASVVYQPNGKVFGASKIVRLIEKFTRRLQIQERITTQIAEELYEHGAQGVLVVLEAEHLCMKMRGVRNGGAYLVTTAEMGTLEQADLRNAALQLINRSAETGAQSQTSVGETSRDFIENLDMDPAPYEPHAKLGRPIVTQELGRKSTDASV